MVDVLGSYKQQGLFLDIKCGVDARSSRDELSRARFSDTIKKAELFCRLRLEKNVVVDDWHKTYKDFLMLINSK
ncbi:hypothetical protein MKW94_019453 [Papaver nudicaule]|uniref:Uncharacterized protein n=1 Tax=Papaver nudicaule TaxID=74823 RepID=A0AA42ASR6_PAPNU|nr:hypothetical protein [Papaver nudicaule]